MKNDLKIVQISEANNGYIITLVIKDKVSEFARDCRIYVENSAETALETCKKFLYEGESDFYTKETVNE